MKFLTICAMTLVMLAHNSGNNLVHGDMVVQQGVRNPSLRHVAGNMENKRRLLARPTVDRRDMKKKKDNKSSPSPTPVPAPAPVAPVPNPAPGPNPNPDPNDSSSDDDDLVVDFSNPLTSVMFIVGGGLAGICFCTQCIPESVFPEGSRRRTWVQKTRIFRSPPGGESFRPSIFTKPTQIFTRHTTVTHQSGYSSEYA